MVDWVKDVDEAMSELEEEEMEIAIYAEQCVRAGKVCHDPEAHYGERARKTDDLIWFEGTEAEIADHAADLIRIYSSGGGGRAAYKRRTGYSLLEYLGCDVD